MDRYCCLCVRKLMIISFSSHLVCESLIRYFLKLSDDKQFGCHTTHLQNIANINKYMKNITVIGKVTLTDIQTSD